MKLIFSFATTTLCICLTAFSLSALAWTAGPVAELNITGTSEPAACVPTLSDGGRVDYGVIKPANLNKNTPTKLNPNRDITLNINCDAEAKVAIKFLNGRPGTVHGGTDTSTLGVEIPSVQSGRHFVGLGVSKGKPIGGYFIYTRSINAVADGRTINWATSTDGGSTWVRRSPFVYSDNDAIYSWIETSGIITGSTFKNLTVALSFGVFISPISELNLSERVVLDGQTTIELIYL